MKTITALLFLSGLFALSGCGCPPPVRYPISGEVCAPDDPVHELRADIMPAL